jgi:hypothetical protein
MNYRKLNTDDLLKLLKSNLGNTVRIMSQDGSGHRITRSVTLPESVQANHGVLGVSITNGVPDTPLGSMKTFCFLSKASCGFVSLDFKYHLSTGKESINYQLFAATIIIGTLIIVPERDRDELIENCHNDQLLNPILIKYSASTLKGFYSLCKKRFRCFGMVVLSF